MKDPKPRQLSSVPSAKEERVGVAYMSRSAYGTLRTLMQMLSMSALRGEADTASPRSDVR